MTAPGHLDFYAIVLFVHIAAAIVAFGVTFVYPIIDGVARRLDPRSLAAVHESQIQIARKLVTPAAMLVLIAGVYLAADRWSDFSSGWWSGGFAILIVILGIEHAVMIPLERRLRDRAALDAQGGGTLSAEYGQLSRQHALFSAGVSLLVVIAVFLMVVKPGA
ncbi:DUF2269 family protein [Conexibacter arvalis]|uniref:Putative membrane protein n=1 Tax=Conexibacter arvalis TaxID=912552 RepID=A0A840IB50_9ACTN|nr:DUF2269 family protein [Conexibacter arvalis]MBB4661481.1 putative membrane protein [Conexibacter arvalis]